MIKQNRQRFKLEEYANLAITRAKSQNTMVTCRCGETPGGTKHIGNFNDNLRSYFIYLIVKQKGYPARHIQTRDNMDPFRKLPDGFYDLKRKWHTASFQLKRRYSQYVGMPLYHIPDPLKCCQNYAEHFRKIYERECRKMGLVDTQYFSTENLYKTGKFNPYLKMIFKKINAARKIDLAVETTKPSDYIPVWVICEKCCKITGRIIKINLDQETVDYVCTGRNLTATYPASGCGHQGSVDWKNGHTKMDWEFEWPAQMLIFGTTIEPFGKEHYIGSWPFAKQVITKVYQEKLPLVFYYEYFLINKQKMATRHGNVIPLSELLQILEPEVIRFIYTKRPRMQRNLELSKIFHFADEFDLAEKIYFGIKKIQNRKTKMRLKKNYKLAMLEKIPQKMPKRISYRNAAYLVQTTPRKIWATKTSKNVKLDVNIKKRLLLAKNWIDHYAPEEIKIKIKKKSSIKLEKIEKKILKDFFSLFTQKRNEREIWNKIQEVTKKYQISQKVFFELSYQLLFDKQSGPPLSKFLTTQNHKYLRKILT